MLDTLVVCISWTNWLIYIALAPNEAANGLMGTSTYDNGQFWVIIDTNPGMVKFGAAGLVFVNACYLYVLAKMLRWQKTVADLQKPKLRDDEARRVNSATESWIRTASARCKTQYKDLTSFRENYGFGSVTLVLLLRLFLTDWSFIRLENRCVLKILNLTMQMSVLLELLESGTPACLIYGYTAFICVGSLAGAIKVAVGK
ncbi:unnamed protein product [Phytophthora lilii]|uniref:Unnamed protein product n=1 Tax=Phytophthora lilii TaxID=2077276 RepID=A0A9W6WPE7_9STRA|nr:unnamed protein product [Phytophthora lilii]